MTRPKHDAAAQHVGRVSPQGVTRQMEQTTHMENVGLRCANPTYGDEWQELKLGDCLEGVVDNRGKTPPLSDVITPFGLIEINAIVGQNKYPNFNVVQKYVSQDTYESWFRAGHPIVGDVIFSTVGSIAEAAIIKNGTGCIAQNLVALRAKKDILVSDYLYYLLVNPVTQAKLRSLDISSVQPSIKVPHLLATEIIVPPWPQQISVVSILNALDDKITLLRETNATLEAIAQAIFKSWFVDFDPVRAKMEGRELEGMDAETAALFPDSFEDSELGEIPRGWQAAPLADACEINPTRRLAKGKQAPYLEMSALPTQGHRPDMPIPRVFSSGTKFINGDTLLARITPCLENGKTAFVDCLLEDEVGWGSTEYIILRPKAPLPSYWAYLLSRHEHFRQYAIQAMVGTSGRQRVEVSRLAQYLVAVSDKRVSQAFAELVEPIQRSIAANDDAAKSLAALRDTLLPRLMSGKINVSADNLSEGAIA